MCSFNYFRFSFAKCKDPQIVVVGLAYKEELGEGRGGEGRQIGAWCKCEIRRGGAYKKTLKWLHMRAKLFGYLRQRLSSFLFRYRLTNIEETRKS